VKSQVIRDPGRDGDLIPSAHAYEPSHRFGIPDSEYLIFARCQGYPRGPFIGSNSSHREKLYAVRARASARSLRSLGHAGGWTFEVKSCTKTKDQAVRANASASSLRSLARSSRSISTIS
jgi:hypothetical protein